MKYIYIILIVTTINLFSHECNAVFLEEIQDNKNLTEIQKETIVKSKCYKKYIVVSGKVTDVYSSSITLKDKDGTEYFAYLLHNEACGVLYKINKGDPIKIKGYIERIWISIKTMNLENCVCIND